MSTNQRPAFYAGALIVWLIVGLGPAIHHSYNEQNRIDDEFYSKLDVPSPEALFIEGGEVSKQLSQASNWSEYGAALARVTALEVGIRKYSRKSWGTDDPAALTRAEARILSLRTAVTSKVNELGQRERNGDATVGKMPEGGFRDGLPKGPGTVSWANYWPALWSSWIFAFIVLLVRLDACGFRISLELMAPWRLLLATAVWPVGLFKYPTGDPARQLRRVLRFAAYAVATGLSLSPAVAAAQTKGGKDNKKKSSPYTFTIEGRNVRVVGPDPKPETVVKATITTPQGWVAQSTFVKAKEFWATTNLAGHIAYNRDGVRVDAVAGLSRNSAGATVVPVGVVASVNRPRWVTAFPFAGYERRLDKPAHHVTAANQTLMKFGSWRVGTEAFVKKAGHLPTQWSTGVVGARTVRKKGYGEVVIYRNQTGEWRYRGRFSFAHSW